MGYKFKSKTDLIKYVASELYNYDIPGQTLRLNYSDGFIPEDEYLYEAEMIVTRFDPNYSPLQFLHVVYGVFQEMFGEMLCGPKHDYIKVAKAIYGPLCQFVTSN